MGLFPWVINLRGTDPPKACPGGSASVRSSVLRRFFLSGSSVSRRHYEQQDAGFVRHALSRLVADSQSTSRCHESLEVVSTPPSRVFKRLPHPRSIC